MKASVRFIGGDGSRVATYMGETLMERMEVSLQGSTVCVPLSSYGLFASYDHFKDPVGNETRREFGERLKRAARSASHEFEKTILASLREQGHLV